MKQTALYFGAAYYDEYMPFSRVEEDFRLMEEAGMNVIRVAESTWSTWEPREGEFHWEGLRQVLEAAQRHGISVIVGTPTYAIPPWLAAKYPDILAETHEGPGRYGPRQNMDITHPGYLAHCETLLRRLLEVVCPFPNVIGFQLDNETKPYDTCGPRVQARFRDWLREKFGTVEALNRAYGLAYWSNSLGSWEDLPDVRGTINGSLAAEFAAFQRHLVTEFLAWQGRIVEEYRRPDQFVTHNFDYAWCGYSYGLQPQADQFAIARSLTVAGCDIYHPTAGKLTGAEISFGGDLARGLKLGENYLVLETQAQGPLAQFPYPGQLRLHAFAHLANGANMIEYWHWHSLHNAIECHWKGVLSHDLQPNAAYREIASLGRDLQRIGSHLVNLRRKSPVALLVSNRSLTGMANDASFSGLDYNLDGLRWLYDALYRRNIPCDLISDETRDFSGYRLVAAPCLYCAEEGLIQGLRAYVAQGGSLLGTFRSFFTDENLTIRHEPQPYGLTDVFGLTYDSFCNGLEVPEVEKFMELLRPAPETRVLKTYDHYAFSGYAAATLHAFGQGQAAYLGAHFTEDALDALLETLLPALGIPLPEERWPLIYKEGINDFGRTLRYLLNYVNQYREVPAPFPCREMLTGRTFAPGDPVPLAPWGAAILESC